MIYKAIFTGRLEFGSSKSYDKALKMYQRRVEMYYKSDILLKEEEIFEEASASLSIPRHITQGSKKTWKNTLSLLEYMAQFAVAGNLVSWLTDNGKILCQGIVEPKSDRTAVREYIKGRSLSDEAGKENEAMQALNNAIEKYERHAQAYERRGHINFILTNYEDAIYDFSKSIAINPNIPEAYIGRASVYMKLNKLKSAVADLEKAVRTSIPLQPVYWKARRIKGDCLFRLGDFQAALLDLKLFSQRKFKPEDPNYKHRRSVLFHYGKALLETGSFQEAADMFEEVLLIADGSDSIAECEKLFFRGIARQKAGKTGYIKDWEKAVELGSENAVELLKEYS